MPPLNYSGESWTWTSTGFTRAWWWLKFAGVDSISDAENAGGK